MSIYNRSYIYMHFNQHIDSIMYKCRYPYDYLVPHIHIIIECQISHLRKLKLMMAAKIDAKEVISIVTLKSKSAINDALAFKGKDKDLQTFANQVEEAVKRMKREPTYLATSNTPVIMMDTFQCSERICRK